MWPSSTELERANPDLQGEIAVGWRIEAELIKARDRLDQRVAELTATLQPANQEAEGWRFPKGVVITA